MEKKIDNLIRSVPIWKNTIEISKIEGGLTNQNFLIQDNKKKFVVRLGEDIPEHLVSRSNEIIASKAAAEFNIGPKVVYNSKGILVLKYIESIALSSENVKDKIDIIIPLIKKIHFEMPKKIIGRSLIFWVFHVIHNYENFLKNKKSSYTKLLPELLHKCDILEKNHLLMKLYLGIMIFCLQTF